MRYESKIIIHENVIFKQAKPYSDYFVVVGKKGQNVSYNPGDIVMLRPIDRIPIGSCLNEKEHCLEGM